MGKYEKYLHNKKRPRHPFLDRKTMMGHLRGDKEAQGQWRKYAVHALHMITSIAVQNAGERSNVVCLTCFRLTKAEGPTELMCTCKEKKS